MTFLEFIEAFHPEVTISEFHREYIERLTKEIENMPKGSQIIIYDGRRSFPTKKYLDQYLRYNGFHATK